MEEIVKGVDGIRYASADALVCLKALAYLNLLSDKQAGKKVNANDIKKHRRDGGEHNLRQYTAHLGKTEGAKMTATPAWYDSPEREQNTIPTMKPGMTAILITGDSARNKVQTMPGGGYASVKVELPGNTEDDIEAKISADFEKSEKILSLRKAYYEKFRTILTPSQIQAMYDIEKEYKARR